MIDFSAELFYKTSRSRGAGGQNVNKVETSVTVLWDIASTQYFGEDDKNRLFLKLKGRINTEGTLQFTASEARSQIQNKKIATARILQAVNAALVVKPTRLATKPSKGQIQKRLDAKKRLSDKKDNRKYKF